MNEKVMTSAVIVNEDYSELYELGRIFEYTNGHQPLQCYDDKIIIVDDEGGDYIGFIMQSDLHTLWLIKNNILPRDVLSTHIANGKLYSDDPDKDGINVKLHYGFVR